jgi:hypothetical protein
MFLQLLPPQFHQDTDTSEKLHTLKNEGQEAKRIRTLKGPIPLPSTAKTGTG